MPIRRTLPFVFAIAVAAMASSASAQSLFDQGRFNVGVQVGAVSSFNHTYFLLGANVGYYVLHGLQLGASFDTWLGNSPNVTRLSPELRYVLDVIDVVKPYLGGFYRHWFISDGIPNYDSAGGRGGLIFVQGSNAFISAGAAYERIFSGCDVDCSYWYPEIGIALVF